MQERDQYVFHYVTLFVSTQAWRCAGDINNYAGAQCILILLCRVGILLLTHKHGNIMNKPNIIKCNLLGKDSSYTVRLLVSYSYLLGIKSP